MSPSRYKKQDIVAFDEPRSEELPHFRDAVYHRERPALGGPALIEDVLQQDHHVSVQEAATYLHTLLQVRSYMYMCEYICMYMHIHVYTNIRTHTKHTQTHTHTHTHKQTGVNVFEDAKVVVEVCYQPHLLVGKEDGVGGNGPLVLAQRVSRYPILVDHSVCVCVCVCVRERERERERKRMRVCVCVAHRQNSSRLPPECKKAR